MLIKKQNYAPSGVVVEELPPDSPHDTGVDNGERKLKRISALARWRIKCSCLRFTIHLSLLSKENQHPSTISVSSSPSLFFSTCSSPLSPSATVSRRNFTRLFIFFQFKFHRFESKLFRCRIPSLCVCFNVSFFDSLPLPFFP